MKNKKQSYTKMNVTPILYSYKLYENVMIESMSHHTKEAPMYNTVLLYINFIPYAPSCTSTV